MDINGSSEVAKVIIQSAFKVSELSNEELRKKKIQDDKNLSSAQGKGYHIDSEVNSIYPTNEIKGDDVKYFACSKVKVSEKNIGGLYDGNFDDPKIGRNIDIER
ncbi:hypothetical protein CR532_01380 [Candidatus Borreliella tachyglossi]|uniref:Uncharacterized protein n=1 Tax=Candidatus Borreliella tachyglossi TaxID=1964448 RepID=A0A2S1LWH1_9SPIR|nr:hypothetical protein [Candidatus Borreliella tachyglossi]AWG42657.1 hypothetical protein CR532_01380 [Candidatus Borreliella tachyglossi]